MVTIETRCHLGKLRFDEHETRCVFEHLSVGIGFELLTPYQNLHPLDSERVVSRIVEDHLYIASVTCLLILAPTQVTSLTFGVGGARHFPATQMVGTRSDNERIAGFRIEVTHPIGGKTAVRQGKRD